MAPLPLDDRGLPPGYPLNPEWEVTPRETRRLLDDPASGVVLIDCRRPEEHAATRIEGAILAPLQELGSRLNELLDHADKTVIVHCHHGRRSMQATQFLRANGFENVRSMAGGIDLWSIDIDPRVPRY